MVFSHLYDEERDGLFLIYKNIKGSIHRSLSGDLFREFWHGFTNHRSEIEFEYTDSYTFRVGNADIPELKGAEYAINVEESGFAVVAENNKGLLHGFMTLLDMIHTTDQGGAIAYLNCGVIRERPRIAVRMVHFCVFPETNLYMLKRFLRFSAALKYTHVIIEGARMAVRILKGRGAPDHQRGKKLGSRDRTHVQPLGTRGSVARHSW